MVERQFEKKVRVLRSDNGGEFMCLKSYFGKEGILHQTSCVYTPQQNGRAERKHRHILNVARSLMFQESIPIRFWGECLLAACHVINRTPSTLLQGKTPYEMLYGKTPDFSQLRVFGSLCFAHKQSRHKDKFGERSRRCVFVGYPFGQKGWRVYDIQKKEFFVSRDVVFNEYEFPFATLASDESPPLTTHSSPQAVVYEEDFLEIQRVLSSPTVEDRGSDHIVETCVNVEEEVVETTPVTVEDTNLGRGQRMKTKPTRLNDYMVYNA